MIQRSSPKFTVVYKICIAHRIDPPKSCCRRGVPRISAPYTLAKWHKTRAWQALVESYASIFRILAFICAKEMVKLFSSRG